MTPVRPTGALVRAGLLAVALVVAALLSGRVDLVVLAVPFIAHLTWAVLRRPSAGTRGITASPRALRIHEGDSAAWTVRADPPADGTLAVALPRVSRLRTRPPTGAAVGSARDALVLDLEPTRWGRRRMDPAPVLLTDPSGSWRSTGATPPLSVSVQPRAQLLQGAAGVARPIGVTGPHVSAARGDGSALADVRPFQPGDRLRRINWRVTSRMGSLHVNATLTDRDTDVLVVTDTALAVGADTTSLDLAVRATTAIVQQYAGFGDRIGLHDLGGRIGSLPFGTGPRQVGLVLDLLARADTSPRPRGTLRPVPPPRPGTLVFFCSPLLDDRVLGELGRLHRLGAEVVAVDTLPEDSPGDSNLPEAWALRRLERNHVLRRLEAVGIPVAPWRGPASLAGVLLALEHARSAPRIGARR